MSGVTGSAYAVMQVIRSVYAAVLFAISVMLVKIRWIVMSVIIRCAISARTGSYLLAYATSASTTTK